MFPFDDDHFANIWHMHSQRLAHSFRVADGKYLNAIKTNIPELVHTKVMTGGFADALCTRHIDRASCTNRIDYVSICMYEKYVCG